ncbi:hypothetical protein E2C01_099598 [Portunus trituberculatus]|uniref:Uncharacterized protein n=1 Tax=Portunus trituberculatus TaxID=210409 RepID=A0A5B7KFR8_PORTR|nr:hypothetical protein [Portunus trituberculatus]
MKTCPGTEGVNSLHCCLLIETRQDTQMIDSHCLRLPIVTLTSVSREGFVSHEEGQSTVDYWLG